MGTKILAVVQDTRGDTRKLDELDRALYSTDEISLVDGDAYQMGHPQGPRWLAQLTGSGGMDEAAGLAHLFEAAPELLAACKAARELYDHLSLGPLGTAAKYGPDYEPPTDSNCLEVRQMLAEAITKAMPE